MGSDILELVNIKQGTIMLRCVLACDSRGPRFVAPASWVCARNVHDALSHTPPGSCDADGTADEDEDDGAVGASNVDAAGSPRSCLHSSMWPARHAARWQASLQYFRCRHPVQRCSGLSSSGIVPQNAHVSMVVRTAQIEATPGSFLVCCRGKEGLSTMEGLSTSQCLIKRLILAP